MDSDQTPATGTPDGPSEHAQTPAPTAPVDDVAKWKEHARTWEKRAKENSAAAAKLAELEKSQMSEIERATKVAADAEARAAALAEKATKALLRSAVVSAATKAGAVDPDAVMAFLDQSAVSIGDDDTVTGVDEAVAAVLAAKPYLVAKPSTPAPGAADGGPQGKSAPTYTKEQIDALAKSDPSKVAELYRSGALNHLLNR
jgi:hypothetical protein